MTTTKSSKMLVVKILLVVLPTLITSFFSYQTARAESEARASAGYETLLEAIQKLDKELKESRLEVARLEGRILAGQSRPPILRSLLQPASGVEESYQTLVADPVVAEEGNLPATLEEAYRSKRR